MVRTHSLSWGEERATSVALFFICHQEPSRLAARRNQSEQTSKQAQEPLILSLWQSITDKKLMALVLACIG